VTDAVMNSSDTKTTPVAKPSVRSRNSQTKPSRARSGRLSSAARRGGRRARRRSAAPATERRGVEEHRFAGAAEPGQCAAEHRTRGHARVARRLDQPVDLDQAPAAGDLREQSELGRLRDGEAHAQQRREYQDGCDAAERQGKAAGERGLDE
jgi:hypothetical protein